ncbi:MAG: glycosyltransferase family 1 protein [Candidatus Moraniibacteriota bacterium]
MRVGINALFLAKPYSGIGQVTRGFLQSLFKDLDHLSDFEFVLYVDEAPLFPIPARIRVEVVRSFWPRHDLFRIFLLERFVLPRAVRRDRCDAFLSLYQSATRFASGFPHTMVVHDVIPEIFPEYQGNSRKRFYWQAVKQGIRSATRLIAVSQSTKNDIVRLLGYDTEKIAIALPAASSLFERGLPEAEWQSLLRDLDLKPGYLYFGGGLEVRKNAEALLRAYQHLNSAALPLLVISGFVHSERNPLATPMHSLIAELGLAQKVRLLGAVNEETLAALYRGAAVFVYPSAYEGFGLPVLEALASGTPVLAAHNSALPEVGGEAVEYLNDLTPEGIAGSLRALLENEVRRKELAAAGPLRAEHFSWSAFRDVVLKSLT